MSSIEKHRRAHVRAELADIGIDIFSGDALDDVLLDELAYALWPPVHERRQPSYGAILLRRDDSQLPEQAEVIGLRQGSLNGWRLYCDGESTFLVRSSERDRCLLTLERTDELALAEVARSCPDLIVVQRTEKSIVKVFSQERLYVFDSGMWMIKPYAASVSAELAQLIGGTFEDILCAILNLCLHVLSARHVGGILVWYYDDVGEEERNAHLTRAGTPPEAELQIRTLAHLDALATRLAQLDGACILQADGTICALGAHLGYSSQAERCVRGEGGTRHTAAKRFSFDQPRALVFVVSEDGSVRVYSDGVDILCSGPLDEDARTIPVTTRPHEGDDVTYTECGNCGKPLCVESSNDDDSDGQASGVACPVCSHRLAEASGAQPVVRVLKPTPSGARPVAPVGQ